MTRPFDVVIIGGGIVGLSTAYQLLVRQPLRLALLEKEPQLALHQTGRNSGVVHSGIYYKPGSFKAKNCLEGRKALFAFCQEKQIPFEQTGKLILATHASEIPALHALQKQGVENGVASTLLNSEQIREKEPYAGGIQGLWVPSCAIIDYTKVAQTLSLEIQARGGEIFTHHKVLRLSQRDNQVLVETNQGPFSAKCLVNCAGLHSDTIAQLSIKKLPGRIFPFRGEYYRLASEKQHLLKHLIYPVPHPAFPFLGVHLTRNLKGFVEAGPNAVLALGKEAYQKYQLFPSELLTMLSYPGFWKMASQHWKMGSYELARSIWKKLFVKDLQKLIPSLQPSDLIPMESGIRAQLVTSRGSLQDDFLILDQKQQIHVLNAPSPAATASFAIGRQVAQRALAQIF